MLNQTMMRSLRTSSIWIRNEVVSMKKCWFAHGLLPFSLCLLCLLAGCGDAASQSASVPAESGNSLFPSADSVSQSAVVSGDPFIVKDVNGNDYDISTTAWGSKYPFIVDYFRDLKAVIQAAGDETREAALLTNWTKVKIPDSCIMAYGAPVVSFLGFDSEGNPDPNGPQITTTIHSANLEDTTPLGAEYFETGLSGTRTEDQIYLNVSLTVENTGSEAVDFYLNSIVPHIFVEGEVSSVSTGVITEMITASNTEVPVQDKAFFRCTLASGQSQDYIVVFYADHRLDIADIYLELNYAGLHEEPSPTEDPAVCLMTGTFCSLR